MSDLNNHINIHEEWSEPHSSKFFTDIDRDENSQPSGKKMRDLVDKIRNENVQLHKELKKKEKTWGIEKDNLIKNMNFLKFQIANMEKRQKRLEKFQKDQMIEIDQTDFRSVKDDDLISKKTKNNHKQSNFSIISRDKKNSIIGSLNASPINLLRSLDPPHDSEYMDLKPQAPNPIMPDYKILISPRTKNRRFTELAVSSTNSSTNDTANFPNKNFKTIHSSIFNNDFTKNRQSQLQISQEPIQQHLSPTRPSKQSPELVQISPRIDSPKSRTVNVNTFIKKLGSPGVLANNSQKTIDGKSPKGVLANDSHRSIPWPSQLNVKLSLNNVKASLNDSPFCNKRNNHNKTANGKYETNNKMNMESLEFQSTINSKESFEC